jgi:DNA-binding HxlR family transcriptional regulator
MSRCRRCAPVPEEVRRAADLLERRYVVSVLYASLTGAARFNEFRQAVAGIPPRTLSERLRDL